MKTKTFQFTILVDEELREEIEKMAGINDRSLSAEIRFRLRKALEMEP